MQKRWNRARMKSEESYFHLENEKFRSIRESVETAALRCKKKVAITTAVLRENCHDDRNAS